MWRFFGGEGDVPLACLPGWKGAGASRQVPTPSRPPPLFRATAAAPIIPEIVIACLPNVNSPALKAIYAIRLCRLVRVLRLFKARRGRRRGGVLPGLRGRGCAAVAAGARLA